MNINLLNLGNLSKQIAEKLENRNERERLETENVTSLSESEYDPVTCQFVTWDEKHPR